MINKWKRIAIKKIVKTIEEMDEKKCSKITTGRCKVCRYMTQRYGIIPTFSLNNNFCYTENEIVFRMYCPAWFTCKIFVGIAIYYNRYSKFKSLRRYLAKRKLRRLRKILSKGEGR